MSTSVYGLTAIILAWRRTHLLSPRFFRGMPAAPLSRFFRGMPAAPLSRFLFFYFFIFSLFSCSSPNGRFRVEGRFKNLNQGEFYIYDFDAGIKDTIGVKDGRFVYDIPLQDTTTLTLLFPNFSEMPIFARPGATVKINGDVSNLRETDISGTKENEAMTAFRLQTKDMMPPEQQEAAIAFINDNPQSPLSSYMLRRYVLLATPPDYQQALSLCNTMVDAQPQNIRLIQLQKQLEGLQSATDGGKLPSFSTLDTKGRSVGNMQLKSKANVILAWASWSFDSQSILRQLKQLQRQKAGKLSIVSICMDSSIDESRRILERDSINHPIICDGRMWQSPIVSTLGITCVPATILADAQGNIIARNLNYTELKEKIETLTK